MGSCYSKKTLASVISSPIQSDRPIENANALPSPEKFKTDEKGKSLQAPTIPPTPQPPPTKNVKGDLVFTLSLPSNDAPPPAQTYKSFNPFKKKQSIVMEDETKLPIPPPPLGSPLYSTHTATPLTMSTVPTLPMSVSSLNGSKAPDNSELPSHKRPDPISEKSLESETASTKDPGKDADSKTLVKPLRRASSQTTSENAPVGKQPITPREDEPAERQLTSIEAPVDALEGNASPRKPGLPQLPFQTDGLSVPIRPSMVPARRASNPPIPETQSTPQEMTKTDRLPSSTASEEQSSALAMSSGGSAEKRQLRGIDASSPDKSDGQADRISPSSLEKKTKSAQEKKNLPMTQKPPMPRKQSKSSILTRPRTTIPAPRTEMSQDATAPKEEQKPVIHVLSKSKPQEEKTSSNIDPPTSSDEPKKSPARRLLARAISAMQRLRPTTSKQDGDRFAQTQPIPIAPPIGAPPPPRRSSVIAPPKKSGLPIKDKVVAPPKKPVVPVEDKEVWTISGSFEEDLKLNRDDALEKPQLLKTLGLTNEMTKIMRPPDLSSILAARNNLNKRQSPSLAKAQARAALRNERPMYTSPQKTDANQQSDTRPARKSLPQLKINSLAADKAKPSARKEHMSKMKPPTLVVPAPKDNKQPATNPRFTSKATSTTELESVQLSEELPVSISSSPPLNSLVYLPSRNQKRPMRTKATLMVKSRTIFPPAPSTTNLNGEQLESKKMGSKEGVESSEGKQLTSKEFSTTSQKVSTTRGESSAVESTGSPSAIAAKLSSKSTAKQLPMKTMTKPSVRKPIPQIRVANGVNIEQNPALKQSTKASRVQDLIAKFADKPVQNAETFTRRQTVPSSS